ncbi:hypothetical protein B566_EDAN012223 [Ephemera danica]|nr:hypothetical protein B566_EDAN012223 [Ephemera danica]
MSQRQALVGPSGSKSQQPQVTSPQTASAPNKPTPMAPPTPPCARLRPHCNNLWSLWYGVAATGVQALMIVACMRRFAVYASLPWRETVVSPELELNIYLGLVGIATLLLPFFLVGNLGNDGFKLGHQMSACSRELLLPEVTAGGVDKKLHYSLCR